MSLAAVEQARPYKMALIQGGHGQGVKLLKIKQNFSGFKTKASSKQLLLRGLEDISEEEHQGAG